METPLKCSGLLIKFSGNVFNLFKTLSYRCKRPYPWICSCCSPMCQVEFGSGSLTRTVWQQLVIAFWYCSYSTGTLVKMQHKLAAEVQPLIQDRAKLIIKLAIICFQTLFLGFARFMLKVQFWWDHHIDLDFWVFCTSLYSEYHFLCLSMYKPYTNLHTRDYNIPEARRNVRKQEHHWLRITILSSV